MDLAKIGKLEFFAPDEKKFPAVRICREVMEADGTAPVVLNAANEIAVEKFLKGDVAFDEITKIVEKTLNKIPQKDLNSVGEVLEYDRSAREVSRNL
jgi:1-deoxy-D-xylulose-5-phosphate reductoisomerase